MNTIIFHVPFKLDYQAKSASGIRPIRMLEAFKNIGCEVILVDGYTKERQNKIKAAKSEIKKGKRIIGVYSESSTTPTALTDPNHFPTHPFMDFDFFKFCKKNNIPVCLFYRDIYWRFSQYGRDLAFWKSLIAGFFYRYDVKKYQELVDVLYLPSINMAKFLPEIDMGKIKPLPPGFVSKGKNIHQVNEQLNILYIGGLGDHYKMHFLLSVVKQLPQISLTICTREEEWQSKMNEYDLGKNNNISIVHRHGDALQELFAQADICSLFVEPQEYRDFAVPFKLFEYLGEKKPIIASQGTLAGDFVEKNAVGWTIPYQENVLFDLLNSIISNKHLIAERLDNIEPVHHLHTWEARAEQVKQDMESRK